MLLGAVLIALLCATILLHYYSLQNNGISFHLSSNRYTWTYRPTLVRLAVVMFWGYVDHQCRLLALWNNFSSGPCSPERSVVPDYVTEPLPTSLARSAKNRKVASFLGILGNLTLRGVIALSTGLLVLSTSEAVQANFPVKLVSEFKAREFACNLPQLTVMQHIRYLTGSITLPVGVT